jgi:hypothetical protein
VRALFPAQRAVLYNSLGINVQEWFFAEKNRSQSGLELRDVPPGAYFLEMHGARGERAWGRVLVE